MTTTTAAARRCECAQTHEWCKANECPDLAALTASQSAQPAPIAPELMAAIRKVVAQNLINGVFTSLSESIKELETLANAAPVAAQPEQSVDIEAIRDKWKIVDGDCREGANGLLTYHVDAFDEGFMRGRATLAATPPQESVATDLEARQRIAAALGLPTNGIRDGKRVSFAWEYLLGLIEDMVKAGEDAPDLENTEPLAWEFTGIGGFIRYVTDSRYRKFKPEVQKWYRPICQKCAAQQVARNETAADRKDAERWRALMGSARIRPLGSAGLRKPEENNYAHLGLELWTVFGRSLNDEQHERLAKENALGREWLEKYTDIATAMQQDKPDQFKQDGEQA